MIRRAVKVIFNYKIAHILSSSYLILSQNDIQLQALKIKKPLTFRRGVLKITRRRGKAPREERD